MKHANFPSLKERIFMSILNSKLSLIRSSFCRFVTVFVFLNYFLVVSEKFFIAVRTGASLTIYAVYGYCSKW